MTVMNEIIKHHGDNNFKIPHIGKEAMKRVGNLPVVLPVTEVALEYLELN